MIVQIEVNTRCNFRCWFCQNSQYEPSPNEVMSLDDFAVILEKIKKKYEPRLPLISFAAYNEPLLDPYFQDRLRLMTKMGFTYWWLSNGSLLTEELLEFLVSERPLVTNFSFNMCSSDPNVLSEAVGITPIAAKRSLDTLLKALPILDQAGFSTVIKVHGDGSENHESEYQKMVKWVQSTNAKIVKTGVMDRAGMLVGVGKAHQHKKSAKLICGVSNLSNHYIGVKGEVYLCCHDYYKVTSHGNIIKEEFAQIQRSFARKKSLEILDEKFCKQCEFAIDLKKNPMIVLKLTLRPYYRKLPIGLRKFVRRFINFIQGHAPCSRDFPAS